MSTLDTPARKPLVISGFIAIAASFLLCGYEFIRSPSNTLFQKAYGAENLLLVMALVIPATFVALYIYGWMLSWIGAKRTLLFTSLVSGGLIFICHYLIKLGFNFATIFLYLIREAYIILLIEQYWSFINSSLGENEAKKMNGPIVGIASLGAILGGYLVGELSVPLGTHNMLIFGALSVVPAAFFSHLAYQFGGEPKKDSSENAATSKPGHLALGLFRTSRILLILFFLIMITQVVSAVLSVEFQTRLQGEILDLDKQTAYSGRFYSLLNCGAAFMQFAVAPLLLRFVSAFSLQIIIPLCHLAAISYLIINPSLNTAGFAYILFKVFDYSIFRASKEILYIPLSYDARYRAKEVIDFFGYRFSKGGISFVLAVFQKAGFAVNSVYSFIAFIAAIIWIGLLIPIFKKPQVNCHNK